MRTGKWFYASVVLLAVVFVWCSKNALQQVQEGPRLVQQRARQQVSARTVRAAATALHARARPRHIRSVLQPSVSSRKFSSAEDTAVAASTGAEHPRTAALPPALPSGGGFAAVPRTLSVVLPCAFEYELMEKTVESVFKATPADVLHEIIVVDDGSSPPLATQFKRSHEWKVRFMRHEKPRGLIGAKKTGGDAATGDIIVFFDCHVKPDPNYWRPFVSQMKDNYKRVVVPTITNLNVDTWEEFGRPAPGAGGMSKCYITFDSEFKWTTDHTPYVPVMSGGLLAISRQWWVETGGYDADMVGWGGENIDQSLRIWLCGGEIVSAPDSYVAHMWRDGSKPKTGARYSVPAGAPEKNRARAAKAHFGEWFSKKTLTFPSFQRFVADGGSSLDVSNILKVKEGLKCKPFSWYLDHFSHVYRDGGVLPRTIYQLEALGGGAEPLCLQMRAHQFWTNAGAPDDELVLRPCSDAGKTQWWHRANRAASGERKCCTGMRNWNSDQCVVMRGGKAATTVCDLDSGNTMQMVSLGADGKLRFGFQGAGDTSCVSASRGGSVTVAACSAATKWRRRHAKTPVEFSILDAELQEKWPKDDA